MKRFIRTLAQFLAACLASAIFASPAMAIPVLPSSFYGTVNVNGQNVPDGVLVEALIDGQVFARGYTQTYQGDSVYTLDVPGDDTDTVQIDGGRDNDTIQFEIGGALAEQTGIWKSGTNVNLDLTASVTTPIGEPQATPSPVPSQTPIVIRRSPQTSTVRKQPPSLPVSTNQPVSTPIASAQPSQFATSTSQAISTLAILSTVSTPTALTQPSQFPTPTSQPSLTRAATSQPSPIPGRLDQSPPSSTMIVQSLPTSIPPAHLEQNSSSKGASFKLIAEVMTVIVVGILFLIVTRGRNIRRKSSDEKP